MKELEDRNWFPSVLRNFQTEFIGFVVSRFNFYQPFIQYVNTLNPEPKPMTDLCSGSGEPAISIFKQCSCFVSLLLTDKFPGGRSPGDGIRYEQQPTDALEITFAPGTCYTMFNAFHHFTDKEKQTLVRNIQNSGASAFFVEVLEPTAWCLLKFFLMSTIGCLVLTPFIKPFSIKRLLFTYVIPLNIAGIFFDGIISVCKSRSFTQYQTLFTGMNNTIRIQRFSKGPTPLIMIHIHPTP